MLIFFLWIFEICSFFIVIIVYEYKKNTLKMEHWVKQKSVERIRPRVCFDQDQFNMNLQKSSKLMFLAERLDMNLL